MSVASQGREHAQESSQDVVARLLADTRRQTQRNRRIVNVSRLALLIGLLLLWEASSGTLMDPFWISRPSAVWARFWEWLVDGTLLFHSVSTITAMALGFGLGSIGGVIMGFGLGVSPTLGKVLDPFVIAAYGLPKIALAPLFILWFGIGSGSKVALAAVVVFFLVFYNTLAGVSGVDRQLTRVVALMGASKFETFRYVIIPSTSAWIYTGLKIAAPYALTGAVVGEIIASNRGLGYLVRRSASFFDTPGTFAGLLALAITALLVNGLVRIVEIRTSPGMQQSNEGGPLATV